MGNLVSLVQTSFKEIAPHSDAFAARFYAFLFELDPSLRHMFKGDMLEQGRKLTQILAVVVNGLDKLDTLTGAVQKLGKRHVGYGVTDAHYAIVGTALIMTLEDFLGENFTPEVRDAWTQAYTILSQVAIRGAHQVEQPISN